MREILIFRRNRTENFIVDLACLLLLVMPACLDCYMLFFDHKADAGLACLFLTACVFFFTGAFYASKIYRADIHVDDEGMSWWFWGKRRKYFAWTSIKTITKDRVFTQQFSRPFINSYCLYTSAKRTWWAATRHGMRFDSNIPNAPALIELVNEYIRQYQIDVIDIHQKPEQHLTALSIDPDFLLNRTEPPIKS